MKKSENVTSDRMQRLRLERKIGEFRNRLLKAQENIYFDAMSIDIAYEESIKEFLKKERITAKMQRYFKVEVKNTK